VKQVVQDLRSGEVRVVDVPEPQPREGFVLVAVAHSLISSGTERAMVGLGAKSLLGKARARPDLVRKTIDVARAEGVGAAVTKVRGRLDRLAELGYSCAGHVLDSGGDVRLAPGDAVACVGAGAAVHAGVVSVPASLVVPLDGVPTADAAFAAPAAIALHAFRLAQAGPGAAVAVVGLGLVGQLAGRVAAAAGCRACGTDPRADRRARFGAAADADGIEALVAGASRGRGADALLVCAASDSGEPVELAAALARDRAPVVVVGDVPLELDRRVFYEKELSLVVARSYGPGRYERAYEERGLDFPVGHVRWTEGRNVEAVVDLLGSGALRVDDLVTHRFPASDADDAYAALRADDGALAILLEFEGAPRARGAVRVSDRAPRPGALRVGVIGAGDFARGTLLPALLAAGDVELAVACARTGASARSLADRFSIPVAGTDWRAVAEADDLDAVVIATPHAEHAEMAATALEAGKAVFVEKPLAIDVAGLERVRAAPGLLLVGHNRRFAPLARRLAAELRGPALVQIRVAAGAPPDGHWLSDPEQGGPIVGQLSHFVDLASFLVRRPPVEVSAAAAGGSLLATLRFAGGAAASIAFSTGESGRLAKERIEALGLHGAFVLDDFRSLERDGRRLAKGKRDKGHAGEMRAFVAAARGTAPLPVSFEEQLLVAAATLAVLDAARTGAPVAVQLPV
jgi:predicted dehydrogenase/threonine dehydrogenase-like Zn-dependent dehydrogenase